MCGKKLLWFWQHFMCSYISLMSRKSNKKEKIYIVIQEVKSWYSEIQTVQPKRKMSKENKSILHKEMYITFNECKMNLVNFHTSSKICFPCAYFLFLCFIGFTWSNHRGGQALSLFLYVASSLCSSLILFIFWWVLRAHSGLGLIFAQALTMTSQVHTHKTGTYLDYSNIFTE